MKKFRKFLKYGIIGIIVLGVLGMFIDDGEEATPVTEPTEVASADEPEESTEATEESSEATEEEVVEEEVVEEPKQLAGIGDKLQVGDVVFTVNERTRATNVGGDYGVDSKGEFLVLNVSVENLGNEAITVDSSYFKLLANEKKYESDSSAGIYANKQGDFFYEEVNPDLTLTGFVVFDISPDMHEAELTLQVQTGIFGTETGQIVLQ